MEIEIKPGWQTTEFWISLASASVPILNQLFGWNLELNKLTEGIMIIAPAIFYILSRTLVKRRVAETLSNMNLTASVSPTTKVKI